MATEVRNLAQRSAAAAKEIKTLINDSVQKVADGSKLVDESGAVLTEIVGSVKKVSDIVGEIAQASGEQSAGITQVGQAVTQMDQMTQQNAALVEEAAAASESMDQESRTLIDLMQFFNTGDNAELAAKTVERRSATRPWSARAPKAVQAKAPESKAKPESKPEPVRAAASGGADSDEWAEF